MALTGEKHTSRKFVKKKKKTKKTKPWKNMKNMKTLNFLKIVSEPVRNTSSLAVFFSSLRFLMAEQKEIPEHVKKLSVNKVKLDNALGRQRTAYSNL